MVMNDFDSSLMTALRDEADRATGDLDILVAASRFEAGLDRVDHDRTRRIWRTMVATAAAAAVVAIALVAGQRHHTSTEPIGPPSPDVPTSSADLVLHLHSWGGANPQCPASQAGTVGCRVPVDLAVYADGSVIWGHQNMQGYVQTRLSPQGVAWLKARMRSTGLFDRARALRIGQSSGSLEFHQAGPTVVVAWGPKPADLSEPELRSRFVAATASQAHELVTLEDFLRRPPAWALPGRMYEQRTPAQFVPSHFWVGWDHAKPDPAKLPSPAREVLTANLEGVLNNTCLVISITQAQQILTAMEPLGLIKSGDVTKVLSFDMPGENGSQSFVHIHPSLPNESTCE
jgi:hypothetical protein